MAMSTKSNQADVAKLEELQAKAKKLEKQMEKAKLKAGIVASTSLANQTPKGNFSIGHYFFVLSLLLFF